MTKLLVNAAAALLASGALCFAAAPPGTIAGRVVSADTGQVIPCTVTIQRNVAAGEPPEPVQHFYSPGQFTRELPAGAATVTVSRGFDYRAEQRQVNLHAGERLQLTFRLSRQANLRQLGWYCGDNHVHMIHGPGRPEYPLDFSYVALAARAMGLDYLSIAQNWNLPPAEITSAHLGELCQRASAPDFLLAWNMEEPKNYWRGDVSHCLGHCWFIGMRGNAPSGSDPIQTLFRMSALDYESAKPSFPNFESQALIHALGGIVAYTHPCRWGWGTWGGKGIYPVEAGKFISNLAQELPFDTVAGPTYDAIDILMQSWDRDNYRQAQKLWFMLLDKGYRLAGTASTDAAFDTPESALPGIVRVYTQVDGALRIAAVAQAMKAGHNFVTSGPLLLFSMGGHAVGSIITVHEPSDYRVSLQAYASGADPQARLTQVELLRNGVVVRRFDFRPGRPRFTADFTVHEQGTAWYIARCLGSRQEQIAMTNPIYFEGQDYRPPQPARARVTATVTDPATGQPLEGQCEVLRMVGLTPVSVSTVHFTGGQFTVEAPATARLRVTVPGYAPMVKSVFMDDPALLRLTLNLRAAELTDWRTFEEIARLLRSVKLNFFLRP